MPSHISIYGSTALLWGLGRIFKFLNPIHSRQDSFDGGSARREAATYTQNTQNKRTDIHDFCGIRTHDLSVTAGEESSCLRPRGQRDRPLMPSSN
jgi:hypothetical protein